jgi:hypothetical protein
MMKKLYWSRIMKYFLIIAIVFSVIPVAAVTQKWYNTNDYLPALVTEFGRNNSTVKFTNYGDKITVNGNQ